MAGSAPAGPTDTEISELAREILARPAYAKYDPDRYDALRELARWLSGFFRWMSGLREADPTTFWLLLIGMLAVCALLLAHIGYTVWTAMRARPAPEADVPTPPRSVNLRVEAQQLAADGKHLEAAHRMWLATLRTLADRRVIRVHPEDANRVIRARLASSPLPTPLRDELLSLIERTETRWFGGAASAALDGSEPADADLYAGWQRVLSAVRRQAGAR